MSFSSDVKNCLYEIPIKKSCCMTAAECGTTLSECEFVCPDCVCVYLRGAFALFGSVTDPYKEYHLSFKLDERGLERLEPILSEIIPTPKRGTRRGKPILYYKDSEKIADFLTYIGAGKYAMEVMDAKIDKESRSNVNRLVNAELANLDKAATAAAEQVTAAKFLIDGGYIGELSEALKQTAVMRIENPDLSVDEFRRLFSPPLSKTGVLHRMKKIMDAAKRFSSQKD